MQDILIMMLLIGATAAVKDSQGTSPVTTQANMTTTTTTTIQTPLTTTQGLTRSMSTTGNDESSAGKEHEGASTQKQQVAKEFCDYDESCGANGKCATSNKDPFWMCNCSPHYFGPTCKEDICYTSPCGPGGTCTNASETDPYFKCKCKDGYTGAQCENDPCQDKGPGQSNPCQNQGACSLTKPHKSSFGGFRHFSCSCPSPYRGENCQISPCDDNTDCGLKGECREKETKTGTTDLGYFCKCNHGYTGAKCEEGPCAEKPCGLNGECSEKETKTGTTDLGYSCECNHGYTGAKCEKGPCAETPCGTNGDCSEKETKTKTKTGTSDVWYSCECNDGYTGAECEEAITTTTTTPTTTATTTRITKTKSTSHGTEETTENDGKTPTNTDNPLPTHAEETTENDGKTPTNTDNPLPAHAGPNIGVIIGSILAVAVVVIALIGFGRWYRQKRRAEQRKKKDVIPLESVATQGLA